MPKESLAHTRRKDSRRHCGAHSAGGLVGGRRERSASNEKDRVCVPLSEIARRRAAFLGRERSVAVATVCVR